MKKQTPKHAMNLPRASLLTDHGVGVFYSDM